MTGPQRRTIIVTGAAGGIGRALLARFAAEGARLVAVDIDGAGAEEAVRRHGADHLSFACDQADEAATAAMFRRLEETCPRIDVLCNNAALGPSMAPTAETSAEQFRRTLSVNLTGAFVMAREAAARMGPGGVVVNTASLAGVLGNPRRGAYAASKAGLISLTRSLACEWAARGLRVCAVAPGYVRTPMVAALEAEGKADLAAVRRRIPLGRLGRADEIAACIGFLASPRARYATGAVLAADGGWMSFNQPGEAHPGHDRPPGAELSAPPAPSGAPCSGPRRRVAITGAAHGIGAAIARRFAAEGAAIALLDRDAAALDALAAELEETGAAPLPLPCDVARDDAVTGAFAALRDRWGGLDILVNNAAMADGFAPAAEQEAADLDRVLEVNLTGAFLCARAAIPLLGEGGAIINLGSINSVLPFAPRHAYGASKAGIDIFTRCLAAELGPAGIRAVTLAPGYIRTPGVAALEAAGRIDAAAIRRRIPMGDFGRPEDIAEAALFLASGAASYVSGGALYIDGGWTAFGAAGDASDGAPAPGFSHA